MAVDVRDNAEEHRFEIAVDGDVAGFAVYRRRPGLIAFTHTEVDDGHEGEGLGSRLVGFALDSAREAGEQVLPFCPFVAAYVRDHAEYAELVPADRREEFGL
jgi:predicted GNAT family acetyltransferase